MDIGHNGSVMDKVGLLWVMGIVGLSYIGYSVSELDKVGLYWTQCDMVWIRVGRQIYRANGVLIKIKEYFWWCNVTI